MRGGRPATRLLVLGGILSGSLAASACSASSWRYPEPGTPAPVPMADTLPIPEPDELEPDDAMAELLKQSITGETGHLLSVSRAVSGTAPARNLTAFDDVVPSAWYEPRITGGEMGPAEAAAGPPYAPPDTAGPLTVVDAKVGGVMPGFTVEDRKGDRYLLKFDPPGMAGLSSGADVVTSRIFWAAGYHVPLDVIVSLDPSRLRIAPDAEVEGAGGETRSLTRTDVEEALARTSRGPDGRIRALASRFLPGVPKGPFRFQGRRTDDPNDHYPHEDRRELRGMWVLAAWTNHVDLRFQNTLDTWIDPPGYLRHHLIDFGTSLGSGGIRALNPREGSEYALDVAPVVGRLVTLGAWGMEWEGMEGEPLHPALGWLATETFDPEGWKPFNPNEPFRRLTPRDRFWGARRVAHFTPAHLRAIIAEARYPDEAGELLLEILLERRDRVLRHAFGQVAPVVQAEPELRDGRLRMRFRDLGLDEGLWSSGETAYRWAAGSRSGVVLAREGAHQRVDVTLAPEVARTLRAGTGPVAVELSVERPGAEPRPARLRIRGDGEGGVRLVGLIY